MTLDEAGAQIESAIQAYGAAAVAIIERILDQVKSEMGQEAANTLIETHDLELRYNIPPAEFDFGSD
jgi:regulator of PEP synthase PpsR (kinase-PPPase family)